MNVHFVQRIIRVLNIQLRLLNLANFVLSLDKSLSVLSVLVSLLSLSLEKSRNLRLYRTWLQRSLLLPIIEFWELHSEFTLKRSQHHFKTSLTFLRLCFNNVEIFLLTFHSLLQFHDLLDILFEHKNTVVNHLWVIFTFIEIALQLSFRILF